MEPCSFVICRLPDMSGEKEADLIYHRLTEASFTLCEDRPDLVIVLGGDGSFLYAVHEYRFTGNFILINYGHLGFFADYDSSEIEDCLDDIISKEEVIEKIPIYDAFHDGKRERFINDLALQSERTAEYSLKVDDQYLTRGRASGVIVSTPIGSTGFNSSIGSPLMLSDLPVYQYSFMASVFNHLYLNIIKKGILSDKQALAIDVNGESSLIIDGQKRRSVTDDEITIRASDDHLCLIHFKDSDNLIRIKRCLSISKEE